HLHATLCATSPVSREKPTPRQGPPHARTSRPATPLPPDVDIQTSACPKRQHLPPWARATGFLVRSPPRALVTNGRVHVANCDPRPSTDAAALRYPRPA